MAKEQRLFKCGNPECGKEVQATHGLQKYCDLVCQERRNIIKRCKGDGRTERTCYCGVKFTPSQAKKKYHTKQCQNRAKWDRCRARQGKPPVDRTLKDPKKEKHNAYMRKYYQEHIKPRILVLKEAEVPEKPTIYPIEIRKMSPEQILRNWDRIV